MNTKQVKENLEELGVFEIFKSRPGKESLVTAILIVVGIILTPVTLIGVIWFYIRSYYRHLRPNSITPDLSYIPQVTRVSMVIGGVFIWVLVLVLFCFSYFLSIFGPSRNVSSSDSTVFLYVVLNLVISLGFLARFRQWRLKQEYDATEDKRYGDASFANPEEFDDLNMNPEGIYLGNVNMKFADQGHILTVAGTRSGKFTNLIANNMLGAGNYSGSWVVIDAKGETFIVTQKYQKSIGQAVIVLNPLNILEPSENCYNPLDLIEPNNEETLIDDASVIAQMIVPIQKGSHDPYWDNRARSLITGMVIHLMLTGKEKTLTTIWKWLRLNEKEFSELIYDMSESKNDVVKGVANELSGVKGSEKAYASILSSAQDATDFLKSPALQRSLASTSFDLKQLSNGTTTLYVVIPPDKLDTHSQWLRLVVTTSLLAVTRNKNKRVTFVLDEFASLGYMPIIERFMGLGAGYDITLWPIFQDLTQLSRIYGEGWQTFIGNSTVRQWFGVSDNFTADYISHSLGISTFTPRVFNKMQGPHRTSRPLMTPDEVRSASAHNVIMQYGQRNPFVFPKIPYYIDPLLVERADENPYSPFLLNDPALMKRFVRLPKSDI